MKLLNLGCGSTRPQEPEWTNVDSWEGGGHNITEPNFVFHDIRQPLPFANNSFDGVLLSHCLEHFDAQDGLRLMQEIHRVLHHGGYLIVSVPDASYFRKVYPMDKNENWPALFEVSDPPNPIPTFFEAALWFDQHKAILSEDTLWAYFKRAGFNDPVHTMDSMTLEGVMLKLAAQLNRIKFSLIMSASKP